MRIIATIKGDYFIDQKRRFANTTKKDSLLRLPSTATSNFFRVIRLFGKSEVAVFMVFCLLNSLLVPVFAANVLGVNEDDWASYDVDSSWHSEIPGDTIPQYLENINHTEWRLQVVNILNTDSIRLSLIKYYRNGTEMSVEIHEGNVRTDSGNLSTWVVRKNLEIHELLYEGKDLTVNATESHEFAGAMRSTVYAWFVQDQGYNTTGRYGIFWDKETGILCGGVSTTIRTVGDKYLSTIVIRTNIVETSLWKPSSYNFWLLGIVVIIIVLVLIVVVFAQRHGKSKRLRMRKRSA